MRKHLQALAMSRKMARRAVRPPLPVNTSTGQAQMRVRSPNTRKVMR